MFKKEKKRKESLIAKGHLGGRLGPTVWTPNLGSTPLLLYIVPLNGIIYGIYDFLLKFNLKIPSVIPQWQKANLM